MFIIIQRFDQYWEEQVKPEMKRSIERIVKDEIKELIDKVKGMFIEKKLPKSKKVAKT